MTLSEDAKIEAQIEDQMIEDQIQEAAEALTEGREEDRMIEANIQDQAEARLEAEIQEQLESRADERVPGLVCLADVPEQTEGERATGERRYRAGYQQGYMALLCAISDHASDTEFGDPIEIPWDIWRSMFHFGTGGRLYKWGRTDQNDSFELPPTFHPKYDERP